MVLSKPSLCFCTVASQVYFIWYVSNTVSVSHIAELIHTLYDLKFLYFPQICYNVFAITFFEVKKLVVGMLNQLGKLGFE